MKRTCHSKGCPVTSIHSATPSGGNTSVYSCMKMVLTVPNVICGKLSQASCIPVAIWQWLWLALEKELVPASSCIIRVQLARDLGILLARAVVHNEEHVASQKLYVDLRCPAEKSI